MSSMPDQQPPEIGELFRAIAQLREDQRTGFAALNARLDRVVSVDVYESNNRRVDERIKDLTDDIQAEREARKLGLAAEKTAREKSFNEMKVWVRWLIIAIVVPVGLFIANMVMLRGGAA